MLRVGECVATDELPDVWCDAEEEDIVLNSGLRRALQHATAAAMAQQSFERKTNAVGRLKCSR